MSQASARQGTPPFAYACDNCKFCARAGGSPLRTLKSNYDRDPPPVVEPHRRLDNRKRQLERPRCRARQDPRHRLRRVSNPRSEAGFRRSSGNSFPSAALNWPTSGEPASLNTPGCAPSPGTTRISGRSPQRPCPLPPRRSRSGSPRKGTPTSWMPTSNSAVGPMFPRPWTL